MQNSDKLSKKKTNSLLASVAGNFSHVKTNNEMLFLDYGPGSRPRGSVVHFLGCFRDLRVLRTYPIYSNLHILRRGVQACTSERRVLSFELGLAQTGRVSMKVFET